MIKIIRFDKYISNKYISLSFFSYHMKSNPLSNLEERTIIDSDLSGKFTKKHKLEKTLT